ncbi:Bromodomain-containing protein, partial [Schizophyllum amplum]
MNNLLRTLRENQKQNGYHNPDLKRLLAEVKAERKAHDTSKLTEPFYESLEGMLHELRTVTIDNHDAEAFLKPVSRADAPDYHEVIQEPMDLQTMLRKVRQRSYKSKREFKDDLDRIWDNCFQYNAAENHPLRKCATRLKAKAECLLQNLTDRKERSDPVIPPELIPPSKANGVNGHSRTPSSHAIKIPIARRNTPGAGPAKRGGNPDDFPNELAVPRTTDGMAEFKRLDDQFAALDDQFAALDSAIEGKPGSSSAMAERLRGAMPLFAPGTKRKLDEDAETPPGKRHSTQEQRELHDLWWQANQKSDGG